MGKADSANPQARNETPVRIGKLHVLRRMGKYLFSHPVWVFVAFFLMLSSNLLSLAAPKISAAAIDLIQLGEGNVALDLVFFYVLLLFACYAVSSLLAWLLAVSMVHLSQKIIYRLRREVFEHLTTLPVGYFDTHQTGDIISHISYDIDTLNASLSHDLLQVCASMVSVVGALGMMISISPVLVLVFAFTVPVSLIFTRYKSRRVRPLFKERSKKLGELNGYAEEMLSGQKTIRAYSRENVILSRFDERNNDAVEAYYRAEWYGAMIGPAVNLISNASIAMVTMFGGLLYMLTISGASIPAVMTLTLGGVSAFVQYSRRFAGPINEMANIFHELQSGIAAAERVFRLLDEPSEIADREGATTLSQVRGAVDFEHVDFGYTPERVILKNLSLKIHPGMTVAIVGPTGAGKTTIINLLMRFYDVGNGEIRVDGTELRDATRRSLRAAYTMVLQDTWLFGGTILQNITYGREDATREQAIEVAKKAHIHEFIEALPQGYDTVLSDDGVNISKGQKQLITIARAMLSDAPMLILDEATSNVDSRTEQQIQTAMQHLMQDRTAFVIAHRLSTIQNADVILVLQNGQVVESGNHRTLMQKGGFYATLYNSQFT